MDIQFHLVARHSLHGRRRHRDVSLQIHFHDIFVHMYLPVRGSLLLCEMKQAKSFFFKTTHQIGHKNGVHHVASCHREGLLASSLGKIEEAKEGTNDYRQGLCKDKAMNRREDAQDGT